MQRRRRPDLEISVVPAPTFATATGTVAIKTTTSGQDCLRDTLSHRAEKHSLRSNHHHQHHRDLLQHALDLDLNLDWDQDQNPDQDQHLLGLPQHQHPRPRQAQRAGLAITAPAPVPKQQTQPPAAQGDLSAKHATGAFLDEKTPTTLDETLNTIPGLTLAAMSAHGASDGSANPMPHKDDAAPGPNTLGGASPNNSPRGPSSRADARMSHDLSLSPRNVTRDSLVTNMLLSLDQLSMSLPTPPRPQYNDDDAAASPDIARVPPVRTGAGHEYSYSSDLDTDAETSSRASVQYARGRRSNSGSNFHSTLGRINSMREPGQRSQPATPRAAHSRARKGSKSSSSNSMDAGYPHVPGGGQRWANGFTNGSPSGFSPAQNQQPPRLPDSHPTTSWQLDFSDSFFSNTSAINNKSSAAVDGDDFDAAPTPTIPAGPRRLTTVPSMPSFPTTGARTQSITSSSGVSKPQADPERKRSTRSSRSATVGRSQSRAATSRDVPPVPGLTAFDADSAPAPSIGYEKSKEQLAQAGRANNTAPTPAPQPKEKLGFFRRVFGSRRDSNANSIAAADSQTGKQGNNTQQTEALGQARAAKAQSTPPSRDSSHSTHGGTTHGTLHKKTSAFFRRQKKVQHEPPPPPPPVPQSILDAAADATPVAPAPRLDSPSSNPGASPGLTRALEPYLASNGSDGPARTARHDDTAAQRATADAAFGSPKKPKGPLDSDLPRSPRGSAAARTESKPLPAPEQQHHESTPQKHHTAAGVLAKRSSASRIGGTPTRQAPEPPAAITRTGSFLNCDSSDTESESESRTAVRPDSSNRRVRERRSTKDGIRLVLPLEGSVFEGGSMGSRSATSLPSVKVDEPDSPEKRAKKMGSNHTTTPIDEPGGFVIGDPTEDERQKAQKIYDGNEDFIQKEKAAAWMGEEGPVRQRTLQAYMSLFDFAGRSIVSSLRDICVRLILKAETQQVDRILAAFAKRWCECNPKHGFKATDVVHTICYSIMLLNTDLHMADIEQKMTRSQFVKNTIGTIRQALADTAPDAFGRQSILPGKGSGLSPEDAQDPMELEKPVNSFRQSFLGGLSSAPTREAAAEADECGPLVKTPFEGTLRAWEAQIETVLKDTYASIRDERLPLFGAEPSAQSQPSANLSVIGLLKRSPSVLSKAPSESQASVRGRVPSGADASRLASLRWTSKSRSRARGAPGAPFGTNGFSSSRTSFDDGGSIWSPTISSATRSRYSLGRTQTSMSIDSIGSGYTANFPQSIGFANALSQAIIREDAIGAAGAASLLSGMSGEEANSCSRPLLEDESLELAGPPWVKEGRVIHKHHLDGIDKRAKDRNWSEVFAVVQKGSLSLFSFAPNKSMGKKSRGRAGVKGAVVVGGGNWQDSATNLATFSLKQTLASALPPPGYSSSRPHVWALSLPTGAVHLFQVSTPETSQEFVTTVNYWSARLSTHPLVGGISNIEYGWGDAIVNNPLVTAITEASMGKEADAGAVAAQTSRPGSAAAVVRGHRTTGSMHSRAGSFRSGSLDFVRARSGSVQSASAVMDLGNVLVENPGESGSPAPAGRRGPRSSSSFSSSVGPFGGSISAGAGGPGRGKLPGDRIHIAEWRPPAQSLRASTQAESEQLSTLSAYVASIEEELRKHNALRSPMLLAFSPRSNNASRAMGNWQRKSEYLLRESVKYRTYVDALQAAAIRKEEVYGERKEE